MILRWQEKQIRFKVGRINSISFIYNIRRNPDLDFRIKYLSEGYHVYAVYTLNSWSLFRM